MAGSGAAPRGPGIGFDPSAESAPGVPALTPAEARRLAARPAPASSNLAPVSFSDGPIPNPLTSLAPRAALDPNGWDEYPIPNATPEGIRSLISGALASSGFSVYSDVGHPPRIRRLPERRQFEIRRRIFAERDVRYDGEATRRRRRLRAATVLTTAAGGALALYVAFAIHYPEYLPFGYLAGILLGVALGTVSNYGNTEYWSDTVMVEFSWRTATRGESRGTPPTAPPGVPYAVRVWAGRAFSADWAARAHLGRTIRLGHDSPSGRAARAALRAAFGLPAQVPTSD